MVATRAILRAAGIIPDFAGKLSFLSRAENYPEGTSCVEAIETHMSCVFLTDHYAYKLKKPVRNADVDLRTLSARHHNCEEEVRLNRRLTSEVYHGTVPLRVDANGALNFGTDGEIVDWLVKMRRLPAHRMLDRCLRLGNVAAGDIEALMKRLVAFYRDAPAIAVIAVTYRGQLRDDIIATQRELSQPEHALACDLLDAIGGRQLAVLTDRSAMFDARAQSGRIVEGHGDLRPEHICLESPPQIIDCLEFSQVLRTLDPADELGFLALECERLGAPALREAILQAYRAHSGDAPCEALVHFYQSYRACVRAKLAIRHLHEPSVAQPAAWRVRALDYLTRARAHIEQCR